MFDRQLKHAISGHMARGNEHMARGNELMRQHSEVTARTIEAIGEVRRELALARRDREDRKVFIRDITTRSERHSAAAVRAIDKLDPPPEA